jgi:hypothetical protein
LFSKLLFKQTAFTFLGRQNVLDIINGGFFSDLESPVPPSALLYFGRQQRGFPKVALWFCNFGLGVSVV